MKRLWLAIGLVAVLGIWVIAGGLYQAVNVAEAVDVGPAVQQPAQLGAVTTITTTVISIAGTTNTLAACNADGHQFLNYGTEFVEVRNANAGTLAITVTTPVTLGGLGLADAYVTVPATTGDKLIGPFPPQYYNDGNGWVQIQFERATNCTVAVYTLR